MSDTIQTKRCLHCKQIKPISEFHKHRRKSDGLQIYCKSCKKILSKKYRNSDKGKATITKYQQTDRGKATHNKAVKKYQKTAKGKENRQTIQKRFYANNPNQEKATRAVNHAIRDGIIPRPDTLKCSCGEPAKQYHHHFGYTPEHWLDVIPVCLNCHRTYAP